MDALLLWLETLSGNPVALFVALSVLGFANVFVPPIPIEALSIAGGVFAGAGHGSPLIVWAGASLGMSLGSTLLYLLAASRGRRLLRLGFLSKRLPDKAVDGIHAWYESRGVWTLFLGKLIPGMSFATVLAVGLFGLAKRKALPAIFAANLTFFGITVNAGKYVGRDWRQLLRFLDDAALTLTIIALAGVVVVAVGYVIVRRRAAVSSRHKG